MKTADFSKLSVFPIPLELLGMVKAAHQMVHHVETLYSIHRHADVDPTKPERDKVDQYLKAACALMGHASTQLEEDLRK